MYIEKYNSDFQPYDLIGVNSVDINKSIISYKIFNNRRMLASRTNALHTYYFRPPYTLYLNNSSHNYNIFYYLNNLKGVKFINIRRDLNLRNNEIISIIYNKNIISINILKECILNLFKLNFNKFKDIVNLLDKNNNMCFHTLSKQRRLYPISSYNFNEQLLYKRTHIYVYPNNLNEYIQDLTRKGRKIYYNLINILYTKLYVNKLDIIYIDKYSIYLKFKPYLDLHSYISNISYNDNLFSSQINKQITFNNMIDGV